MDNTKLIPCLFAKSSTLKKSGNLEKFKVTVMHSGLNYNKSYISNDAIEEAKETLKNIPILAYIKRDDDGQAEDFDEHNVITKIVQGVDGSKVTQYYMERPIGVIPETNDYQIEEIDGENYVTCQAYIWKNYSNEAYDILTESESKGVSMEVKVEEGEKDKKTGIYNINKFSYLGVTVLGDGITPAMGENCKIERFSTNQELNQAIEELNQEIKKYQKEVDTLEEEKLEAQEKETVEQTEEIVQEENQEELSETEETADETPETEQQNFSLDIQNMTQDIRNSLYKRKCKKKYSWSNEEYEVQEYYLRTIIPSENMAIVEDNVGEGYSCYGIPYTFNGDSIELDFENKSEYIQTWRKKEVNEEVIVFSEKEEELEKLVSEKFSQMSEEVKELNSTLESKETEMKELKTFKLEKDKEALVETIEDIVSNFSTLEESEYKDIKEKAINKEIDVETFKINMYALKGMKAEAIEKEEQLNAKFSKKDSKETLTKVKVTSNIPEFSSARYGSLSNDLARISGLK